MSGTSLLPTCAIAVAALGACEPAGDCASDSDCLAGLVCARNAECLPADEVRAVRITWTVYGQPAGAAACAPTPELYLLLIGVDDADSYGYAPVPCDAGLFVIDKLPRRFASVELGVEGSYQAEQPIDLQGNASFDLRP